MCAQPRPREHHVPSWATNTIFFLSFTEQSQANLNALEPNLPPYIPPLHGCLELVRKDK